MGGIEGKVGVLGGDLMRERVGKVWYGVKVERVGGWVGKVLG